MLRYSDLNVFQERKRRMKSGWRSEMASGCCLAAIALAGLTGGCVVHGHGYAQVDVVDVQGYHHQGYYDDNHAWHGGYYDEHHNFHNDPPDWHR
jgi:hypothetical protein